MNEESKRLDEIAKRYGIKHDWEESEELSTIPLSEELSKGQWNKEFVEAWKKDLEDEMGIVGLLQSNSDAELKLGRNKLYWDGSQWVVLGRKAGVTSSYSLTLYEGPSEQEAVKALKNEQVA